MKNYFKKKLFIFEKHSGFLVAKLMYILPKTISVLMYRYFILVNRILPDRLYLLLFQFLTALGDGLFSGNGQRVVVSTKLMNRFFMVLDISEKTQRQIYSHKCFEASFSRYILNNFKSGDTFVDVGSNVGYFSLLVASITKDKRSVFALEPEKENFSALKKNIFLNNYQGIIIPLNKAAGEKKEILTLNINPLNRGGNSLVPFERYSSGGLSYSKKEIELNYGPDRLFEKVDVVSLDELLEDFKFNKVSLMKIDVEGFELGVLKGLKRCLKNGIIDKIMCEVNNDRTRAEVFSILYQNGYLPYKIEFDGSIRQVSYVHDKLELRGNVLFLKK